VLTSVACYRLSKQSKRHARWQSALKNEQK
jgi:hypothetical protein